jgi:deoxyribodipyrimidine photo-lyase
MVEEELQEKHVPFVVLKPGSHTEVGTQVYEHTRNDAIAVVCDMSPIRHFRDWMENQASPLFDQSNIPLIQIDAHNVVPVWFASPKREVGARTLRPKINKLLPDFLTHFPEFQGNHKDCITNDPIDWRSCVAFLDMDTNVKPVSWAKPGHKFAMERFHEFCNSTTEGLKNFDTLRNDPNYKNVCSNLSPWINYGHISFQKLALEVRALKKHPNGTASYIEEGK